MAVMEFDAPENQEQDAAFLEQPGKYHCQVVWIEEEPRKQDGSMIANAVFRAHCTVLDGTVAGQRGKECNLMFFAPKLTDKDNGEMAKKKILFFAQSIGCASVANGKMVIKFGPEVGEADYDEGDEHIGSLHARGRQFVVEVEKDREGKYVTMRYANVWHVDNPVVKDVPKDKAALGLLPPTLRKAAKDFAKPGTATGNVATTAKTTPPPTTPPAGKSGGVDVGDL
jgi:hypothetical protein